MREDVTPTLFRRMLATSDCPQEKLARILLVPMLFGAVGPALAVAVGLYALMWHRSPRIGRLWAWPWFAAGVIVAFGGGLGLTLLASGPGLWIEPYPPSIQVYPPVLIPTWLWSQISLGLIFIGLQILWCGWAAVRPHAVAKRETEKNGDFMKTPENKKVRLDPLSERLIKPETAQRQPNKVKLAAFTSADYAPDGEPEHDELETIAHAEDNPVFDGWDADDVEVIDEDYSRSKRS